MSAGPTGKLAVMSRDASGRALGCLVPRLLVVVLWRSIGVTGATKVWVLDQRGWIVWTFDQEPWIGSVTG